MRTLRGRLFAAILGTVLVGVGASLALGVVLTREAVRDSVAEELARQADLLSQRLTSVPGVELSERPAPPPPGGIPGPGPPGPPVGDAPGPRPAPPPDHPLPRMVSLDDAGELLPRDAVERLRRGEPADGRAEIEGEDVLYAARPGPAGVLVLTRSAEVGTSDYGPFVGGLLIASALAAALAALAAVVLSRRLAAPLGRVAQAARELPSRREPEPLPPERTAELAALVDAFNEMAAQLARAREAERAVLLSVSHDLRTPLTAVRGYAEGLADGSVDVGEAAGVIAREADRLERLVADVLALARLEQGVLEVRLERVDLAAIAREAAERLAPRARAGGLELHVTADGEAAARGDHDRVLQVVSNLVDNAVRVTPAGGEVTIAAEPGRLRVSDTGPGIAPEDLPHAFERFHLHRRAGSRDGTGIGLAIVRELTEAMGGSVSVRSEPGGGAEFSVELPPAS